MSLVGAGDALGAGAVSLAGAGDAVTLDLWTCTLKAFPHGKKI